MAKKTWDEEVFYFCNASAIIFTESEDGRQNVGEMKCFRFVVFLLPNPTGVLLAEIKSWMSISFASFSFLFLLYFLLNYVWEQHGIVSGAKLNDRQIQTWVLLSMLITPTVQWSTCGCYSKWWASFQCSVSVVFHLGDKFNPFHSLPKSFFFLFIMFIITRHLDFTYVVLLSELLPPLYTLFPRWY